MEFSLPHRFAEDQQAQRNFTAIERWINDSAGLRGQISTGAQEVVSEPSNLPGVLPQITDGVDLSDPSVVVGSLSADRLKLDGTDVPAVFPSRYPGMTPTIKHFTLKRTLAGQTSFDVDVPLAEDGRCLFVNTSSQPLWAQVTTSHSGAHARPYQLRNKETQQWVGVESLGVTGVYDYIRVRMTGLTQGAALPSADVRFWLQVFGPFLQI